MVIGSPLRIRRAEDRRGAQGGEEQLQIGRVGISVGGVARRSPTARLIGSAGREAQPLGPRGGARAGESSPQEGIHAAVFTTVASPSFGLSPGLAIAPGGIGGLKGNVSGAEVL